MILKIFTTTVNKRVRMPIGLVLGSMNDLSRLSWQGQLFSGCSRDLSL